MRFRCVASERAILALCGLFPLAGKSRGKAQLRFLPAALLLLLCLASALAQSSTNLPLFQFAVFYNTDMDFSPGQSIVVNGRVHCNGTIYMYPQATATFDDAVEATLNVTNADDPDDQQNLTGYSKPIHYASLPSGNPISGAPKLTFPPFCPDINVTNAKAVLNLPPPGLGVPAQAAYAPSNQIYLYNGCDLIISNAPSGTNGKSVMGANLFVFYSAVKNTTLAPSRFTLITNDVIETNIVNTTNGYDVGYTTNITASTNRGGITFTTNIVSTTNAILGLATNYCAFYSFITNTTFYDYREGKIVQAVQLDVSLLDAWFTNQAARGNSNGTSNYVAGYYWNWINTSEKGHPIDSIYIYNDVPLTGSTLPAVRVVHGSVLPSRWGLSVATPMPIYVLGDYNIQTNSGAGSSQQSLGTTNTTWTWPAALMGDAITVLSDNWLDGYNAGTLLSTRTAVATTINAAFLGGIVPSAFTTRKQYSGGFENFLRLLENWNGNTLTCNGSFVAMFSSSFATNFWVAPVNYAGYPTPCYSVPTRRWSFDPRFLDSTKLPPLTLMMADTNPPMIITQPTNQTLLLGNTAVFSVAADSYFPLAYQWNFQATNLENATNAILILTNVSPAQAGNYSVIISNPAGSMTSSNAILAVYTSAAAMLDTFSFANGNVLQFQVDGVPGFNYAVQTSTNLTDWISRFTNASPFAFTDTNALAFPQQFYRAVYLP